jgi:hypothetical protein
MSKGILSISDGIITAANKFNSSTVIFKKALVRNGLRCRRTISAFAPVYASLNSGGFWSLGKSVSPEDMVSGIES